MSSFAKENPFSLFFWGPLFLGPLVFFFFFFLSPAKVGSLEMQPGAKLQAYLGSLFCSLTPARSVLDFESFAGQGQMLDGRVLQASQVEYKPFGKPPLQREHVQALIWSVQGAVGCPEAAQDHRDIQEVGDEEAVSGAYNLRRSAASRRRY